MAREVPAQYVTQHPPAIVGCPPGGRHPTHTTQLIFSCISHGPAILHAPLGWMRNPFKVTIQSQSKVPVEMRALRIVSFPVEAKGVLPKLSNLTSAGIESCRPILRAPSRPPQPINCAGVLRCRFVPPSIASMVYGHRSRNRG